MPPVVTVIQLTRLGAMFIRPCFEDPSYVSCFYTSLPKGWEEWSDRDIIDEIAIRVQPFLPSRFSGVRLSPTDAPITVQTTFDPKIQEAIASRVIRCKFEFLERDQRLHLELVPNKAEEADEGALQLRQKATAF
ncbi:MAG: hypothetical protein WC730_03645 [Patescibacteria group bacterium]|jgi:hypothetical protein